jgi:D-tyrosyl-tRNA(Tyr) deacylase
MRAAVQRVHQASVVVDGQTVGQIAHGLLVYLGVAKEDGEADIRYIVDKVIGLRIFNDADGKMNLSVREVEGQLLVISAFTVQGDVRRGKRPSFDPAAPPTQAREIYEDVCRRFADAGMPPQQGVFQAHMDVTSINDGPICVLLDSKKLF